MNAILEEPKVRERVHPWSVDDYHALGAAGCVGESVELLRGILVDKMSKSPLHCLICQRLVDLFRIQAAKIGNLLVRQEQPLTFSDSEPEPDVAIVSGIPDDFAARHPSSASLVIEVAITSIEVDRGKAPIYAEAGIPEFWLVRPESSEIEVFTKPDNGVYGSCETKGPGAILTCEVFPAFSLPLDELFKSAGQAA